jgi:hypothetical protein
MKEEGKQHLVKVFKPTKKSGFKSSAKGRYEKNTKQKVKKML